MRLSNTFRKLVLVCNITPGRGSGCFGQHHTAHVGLIDSDWLHGPVFTSGVKHHITVDLKRKPLVVFPRSHKDVYTNQGAAVGDSLLRTQRQHQMGSIFPHA